MVFPLFYKKAYTIYTKNIILYIPAKLDKCPICRSVITSYFCIRNDDERDLTELKQQRFFNRRLFNLFHYH
ncbi:hypothetical protein HF086_013544 [Spodoptera exigua]|uniref:Uncharacterized protein n=1 Tax=Spodoptera exigua TaxID=7107 RepID=A0A922MUD2_SPOEX|nr:hypothetical protein HF086_013544 [Spodoptera exigua]